ncbi:MAG TPA: YggS family pyridoxal phosphate-dependent enzyme [Pseudogracilibacillus sp.]|nr:YggS family pyridoxal phosphate-dependent enzyme [Pseudogracilibacillus sp.]
MSSQTIEGNLKYVRERMLRACKSVGRDPNEVKLLLATKTVSPNNINRAIDLGEMLIGESKAQEFRDKYPEINTDHIDAHFIGHLQTNKVNSVLRNTNYIHSVDRLRLGNALHKRAEKIGKKLDILVQVNTTYEESKFGVAPEETLQLIEQLAQLDALNIKGLMTIGRLSADPEEARVYFRRLKSIQEQVQAQNYAGVEMKELSMGMSRDYDVAIEEGATIVRVGTAIFGERMYPDSYYWNEQLNIDE